MKVLQPVLTPCRVGNLRIELAPSPQVFRSSAVPAIELLDQNKLPARRVVAEIEPAGNVARLLRHAMVDDTARGLRAPTPNVDIRVFVMTVTGACSCHFFPVIF